MRKLITDLREIVGAAHVLADPDAVAGYATDWTRRYSGAACCVVTPAGADQVAGVLRACAGQGAVVVPQGGNTGLVGGSVPAPGRPPGQVQAPAVILSTRRLTALGQVDRRAGQVTAGAGVTIGSLRAHAAAAGLSYGVDLAARDTATVGGTIATNAGGIRTIRYGPTRAQVAGITAVLADGSVVSDLSGLTAGSAGYDLAQLLTGSEGTLGVITAARLRLRSPEPAAAVLLAGVAGIGQASALLVSITRAVPGVLAAEYLDEAGVALVCGAAGLPAPLGARYPGYLLAELAGSGGSADPDEVAGRLASVPLPGDTALASDPRGMAGLWAYRERITEAIATAGIPHKIDVAVPEAGLAAFRADLDDVVRAAAQGAAVHHGSTGPGGAGDGGAGRGGAGDGGAGRGGADDGGAHGGDAGGGRAKVIVFGHIGVGNLHVNVLGPDPADTAVDAAVARLAAAHGGSVAAEHGVGRTKTGWLGWTRSAADLAAMRAIKAALDPAGILNPGVLLPPEPPPS